MVCAKCEAAEKAKKSTGLAVTDVWKPTGSGSDQRNERKIGGNKLLEARKRYAAPVPVAGSALSRGGGASSSSASGTSVGSARRGAGAGSKLDLESRYGKCRVCKVTVAKEGAKLCQKCAFKEGKCVLCEGKVLDTSRYKMSSK